MAFHLACPITCQKICYCALGFPGPLQSWDGRRAFEEQVDRLESLLGHPELVLAGGRETVEVVVPPLGKDENGNNSYGNWRKGAASQVGGDGEYDRDERLSSQSKQLAMRKKATLASLAAEDYARKLEQGDFAGTYAEAEAVLRLGRHRATYIALDEATKRNSLPEDKGTTVPKIICRICFSGEDEGTKNAERMLSCSSCNKKYHRKCLKRWAQNRDLFNWGSWVCPSCISCEVCKRTGDPNKLMFCKRCDAPCHSYCQQPPHKNVPPGPYLCPKHTWCHSCGSTVPGSGISTRWFVGCTTCDACGRLFIKEKYCPICLKVYRDSESTPMVCCDACERWVHCVCDGISEEKYQEFQADGNLYYKCAACRGDCYQVKDLEDAVQELWRRRDGTERELIITMRVTAGLPPQHEMLHHCPSSDDDKEFPSTEPEHESTKRFKVVHKGVNEKALKNGKDEVTKQKEYGRKPSKNTLINKKYIKKKGLQTQSNGKMGMLKNDIHRYQSEMKIGVDMTPNKDLNSLGYGDVEEEGSQKSDGIKLYSHLNTSTAKSISSVEHIDNKMFEDNLVESDLLSAKNNGKGHKSKSSCKLSHDQTFEEAKTETEKHVGKAERSKGTKIVIHLPARDRSSKEKGKSYHPAASEASSCHRDEGSAGSQGIPPVHVRRNHVEIIRQEQSKIVDVDTSGGKWNKSDKNQKTSKRERNNFISLKTGKALTADEYVSDNVLQDGVNLSSSAPFNSKVQRIKDGYFEDLPANASQDEESSDLSRKRFKGKSFGNKARNHGTEVSGVDDSLSRHSLKVKLKKPSFENTAPWVQWRDEEEGSLIKGQRSKRKRPHSLETERQDKEEREPTFTPNEDTVDKFLDNNWILMKLGKDAVGKRVEVYQPLDNTWHKGSVTGMGDEQSAFIVHLDDGREETIELGRHSVRLISQSNKRPRT